jgi:Transposase DDE domain
MHNADIDAAKVYEALNEVFGADLHARRVLSLSNTTTGALFAGALGVHVIGLGLAEAENLNSKHAIKQVDRLLSNQGIDVWSLFESWVPFVLAKRKEAVVALDWTDFDSDGQATIALHLITEHGRATPLVWKTVYKSELKDNRNAFEDQVIARCLEVAPRDLKLTLLADRGFADQKLYELLRRWEVSYVIRCRGSILVTNEKGETRRADQWVSPNGRAVRLRNARVTQDNYPVGAVVCVHAARMKEAWCLVTSDSTARATEVIHLYDRRFTIEESFRDTKNPRFGFGLSQARLKSPARRDRLLLVGALAIALLTLLGAAGESLGFERLMKANTTKRRSYSLLRQGLHYYASIRSMLPDRLNPLMAKFVELFSARSVFKQALGLL